MIAPTPPAANLHSQLMRVCVSEPSSLSNRPEMFERKIRFLTVRFRNRSGVKMMSSLMRRPRPPAQQSPPSPPPQGRHESDSWTLRPVTLHEFDVPPGREFARSFKTKNDKGARAHRAGDGGARHNGLAQHVRRRKHALFDHRIDRRWRAPARLIPKLAHAFETAHDIVNGNSGGMNPGEIAVDEIGEEAPRALQAPAEMEENRTQRVARMHRGVEDAGSAPALRAGLIVGNEQAPDRLLRPGANRRRARLVPDGGNQAGDGFFVP